MAKDLGTETVTRMVEERTWWTELRTPVGGPYEIVSHQQFALRVGDDVEVKNTRTIHRTLDEVKDQVFTDGKIEVTGFQLYRLLQAAIDKFRDQDDARMAARLQQVADDPRLDR